jgi:drug/metabolite transporter (DMT)-like permease
LQPAPVEDSAAAAAHAKGPWFWRSPYFLLVFTVLAWSGNFVVGRAVHASVPPIALAFWRWFGALVLVIFFAWPHLRRDWPVLWRHRWSLLLLSAFGVAAFNTCIYLGLQTTTAINALLLQSVMPVAIFAASFALFGERVGLAQLLGLVVSLVGVVVIISHGDPLALAELGLNRGDAWVVAAVVAYALYSALLRRRPAVHPLSLVASTFAIGTAILLPLAIGERLAGRTAVLEPATFLAIGYVAVFPSLLAYLAYNRGVELIGANRAGQFVHLMPAFGSLLAVLFLGETFHLFHAAGLALIATGIVLSSQRPSR